LVENPQFPTNTAEGHRIIFESHDASTGACRNGERQQGRHHDTWDVDAALDLTKLV